MISTKTVYHRYANANYKITLQEFLKGVHYGIHRNEEGEESPLYRLTGFSDVREPNIYGEVVATIEVATANKTWRESLTFTENGEDPSVM